VPVRVRTYVNALDDENEQGGAAGVAAGS
jgi:hypothetical protein